MQIQREKQPAGFGGAMRELLDALWDALEQPIGDALADIRRRVVEEGWFGREISPAELRVDVNTTPSEPALGFRELMAERMAIAPQEPSNAPDQGIDL